MKTEQRYTVEVYKTDRRTKAGEKLVSKTDHAHSDYEDVDYFYKMNYPTDRGYRFEIKETYVRRTNIMTGKEYEERYDTPYYCSPSSETYWSM